MALAKAAEQVGMKLYHGSAGRMLRNKHYLGDDYYPQIIDKETFDKVEEVRLNKATNLGRVKELKADEKREVPREFVFGTVVTRYSDPFRQAEYIYGLIESEVQTDGAN